MKRNFFGSLFQRRYLHSLRAKLLLPITGLMLASLLGSTVAFGVGTAHTQAQLLQQQVTADAARTRDALLARADAVVTAATLLTKDPNLLQAIQLPPAEVDNQLHILNNRAVVLRDRFELDLIQIYNRS